MRQRTNAAYYVGLMSGTSVDGIDAALIRITESLSEEIDVQLVAFANTPFPDHVREQLFTLFDPQQATIDKVGAMNMWLGELYSQATLSIIEQAGLSSEQIVAVGSHGQTIYHAPEPNWTDGFNLHYTVQIGEGAVIANRTGIPCVSDFRIADMAVGGQGAPLVPFTEYHLYAQRDQTLLLQNIGGIGNMTVLPAGKDQSHVFAFDTGPGNMIMDGLVSQLFSPLTMDQGGRFAASGTIIPDLLQWMQQDEYYTMPLPKSTGRERFGKPYVESIIEMMHQKQWDKHDVLATATYVTAWSIADSYERYVLPRYPAQRMVISGGGSYNETLVNYVAKLLAPHGVETLTQEEVGGNSDAKEAMAFAILAHYTMRRLPNNLPRVTGASKPVVMGKISWPS